MAVRNPSPIIYNVHFVRASELESCGRLDEAIEAYKLGVASGDVSSCVNLGALLEQVHGPSAVEQAKQYYLIGAERGSTTAMINLAICYKEGGDAETCQLWLDRAREAGAVDPESDI